MPRLALVALLVSFGAGAQEDPVHQIARAYLDALVGVAENGIDLDFVTARKEIKADGNGGADGLPANYLFLNATVIARVTLVPFAGVYVNRLRSMAQATGLGGTPGTLPAAGTLMGYGSDGLIDVAFLSNDPDGGFWLRRCLVAGVGDGKWSPDVTRLKFEFRATAWYEPSVAPTIAGSVLYSRL